MKKNYSASSQKPFHRNKPSAPKLSKNRLIIGRKPMLEALASGAAIDKIFILKSAIGDDIQSIKEQAKLKNIALSFVPAEKLDRFTTANHQGVVAVASLTEYFGLQDLIDQVVSRGDTPLLVVLDGITDTRNLGAIARSAYCFGAHALVLPVSNSAAITEESIKTSAGALEHLPIAREASIEQIFDILKTNGILTAAMDIHGNNLDENAEDFILPMAVVLGAEGAGVSNFVVKKSDKLLRIPQSQKFNSLNVSVAAGVILYEIFKNRL